MMFRHHYSFTFSYFEAFNFPMCTVFPDDIDDSVSFYSLCIKGLYNPHAQKKKKIKRNTDIGKMKHPTSEWQCLCLLSTHLNSGLQDMWRNQGSPRCPATTNWAIPQYIWRSHASGEMMMIIRLSLLCTSIFYTCMEQVEISHKFSIHCNKFHPL